MKIITLMAVELSVEQLAPVMADKRCNIKILAVPGSGKSTVLVYRVERLLKLGVPPERIVAIMFNDSAAVNFEHDLGQLEFMSLPEVKTYHSYARKLGFILVKKGLAPATKFTPNAFHYKGFYKQALLDFIPQHLHTTLKVKSSETLNDFIRFVELCKSTLKTPKEVFDCYKFGLNKLCYIDAFIESEKVRKERAIQFFSDLIYDLVVLCRENPQVINAISNKHDVVVVDEYQDANTACHELIKIVCGRTASVNVVGDDDQTIYDFTGASPTFLKELIDLDFPNIKEFRLTKTFRFGHSVALIANNIIGNNDMRVDKLCVSGRPNLKSTITTATYKSLHLDTDQSDLITEISNYILGGGKYSDIGILVRNYSSTFTIELALLKHGIPYFINAESKAVLHSQDSNILRAILVFISDNFADEERVKACSAFLKSYIWLQSDVALSQISLAIISADHEGALKALSATRGQLKPYDFKIIKKRVDAAVKVLKSRKKDAKYRLERLVKDSGIRAALAKRKQSGSIDPVKRFEALLGMYVSLDDDPYLAVKKIDHLTETTNLSVQNEGIEFSTFHKSKGLAWPYVILTHCEEGVCPSFECGDNNHQIEVERRLFYVGVTRARNKLTFHIPQDTALVKSLTSYDGFLTESEYFQPGRASRFIYESNLLSATKIGIELFDGARNSTVSSTGNRHQYNRYLQVSGAKYRISGLRGI